MFGRQVKCPVIQCIWDFLSNFRAFFLVKKKINCITEIMVNNFLTTLVVGGTIVVALGILFTLRAIMVALINGEDEESLSSQARDGFSRVPVVFFWRRRDY